MQDSRSELPAREEADFPGNARLDVQELAPDSVFSQLDRICTSPHFQASERRRAFLRFIVEETLSGRAERLKGYTIALSVFGRDESFDPQADPVVRLEARRLRRDLDSYYIDAGQNDPIRISIPKGSYAPSFESRKTLLAGRLASEQSSERRVDEVTSRSAELAGKSNKSALFRRLSAAAALIAAIAIGAVVSLSYFGRSPFGASREPGVLVAPFEALSPGESTRYLAAGVGQELIANLFHFSGFRLYTSPVSLNQDVRSTWLPLARDRGVAYVVNGSVQTEDGNVRVTVSVANAMTGGIVWTKSYSRPFDPESLIATQGMLAEEIAEVIGQPYGVVRADMSGGSSSATTSSMDSYNCVLRAHGYRRTFLRAEFTPALQCLERTVQRDPDYSDAWAMLGWLHLDAGRLGFDADDRQTEYGKALEAINNAIRLRPKSTLALKALAAAYHFTGRYEDSERLTRQLVALNPNDPEILAQLGWRLSVRGNFEEGVAVLKRAIDRTLNPPNWYFHFIAVNLYMTGDYQQARTTAERSALGDSGFSQLVLAVSNAELGDRDGTQKALDKLALYEPLARDPDGFLRRQGIADRTVDALVAGLAKARSLVAR
ncbi:tetratricopeptide repeat protein [Bradyrhizobium sp. CCGB01]|uniref:tetratricopeptide repeat protein n=1 Tax=Bradyrhizobium sp. CCGB01 TaxID=2949634 RepID=UPI0020B1DB82|nr:tetratricopeptide repeat protein [Bradyrhizobium sp. CCGB01]MCP3408169.1 tetratricopeptide repeat protein [Bradyrhizobium sp. CCGB01]